MYISNTVCMYSQYSSVCVCVCACACVCVCVCVHVFVCKGTCIHAHVTRVFLHIHGAELQTYEFTRV